MSVNRITLVITPEQHQAAATAMAQVKAALQPLSKLQPGELLELHGFGAKNEVFGRGILRAAGEFADRAGQPCDASERRGHGLGGKVPLNAHSE